MNYSWLLIGAGGGVGAIARYLMQQAVQQRLALAWPVGTGAVNALGCLLAGLLLGPLRWKT
jgi:CrcB protein